MILINAHELRKSFTARPLFNGLTFTIESKDRIGLIGPNGAGKSTLMKILIGKEQPDSGTLSIRSGTKIAYLEQKPTLDQDQTVYMTLMEGAHDAYDWQEMARADALLSRLGLNGDAVVGNLSGGWQKRVALGRELMKQPDLLLLDEPTNHLDVESIMWLEDFLEQSPFAVLTITHDRLFLNRVSNRIMELDRRNPGGILCVEGDYAKYLEAKEERIHNQTEREVRLKNVLRRETEWLRRGAKARTTKQQARIQRHGELSDEVNELSDRNKTQKVRMDFGAAEKNPKRLIEALKVSKSYEGNLVVPELTLLLTPQSRLGLLGRNGSGKSTLIKLLLGRETPDAGVVKHADALQVAYFEQNRESLDPKKTLLKTLCPTGDYVDFQGRPVHIKGYLDRFKFTPEQMDMEVGKLSGGEQARILIAKLMLRPANVLVLDEPTNDLDMETLDVLQEVLAEFNGSVILVSHDRYFLDSVSTDIIAIGPGESGEKEILTFKGVLQWEEWKRAVGIKEPKKKNVNQNLDRVTTAPETKKKKLSFTEQHEFDQMESNIKKAEKKLEDLVTESHSPEASGYTVKKLQEISSQIALAQKEVDRLYARWEELEAKKSE